ncbi:rho GTPase-activating protein 39 isoform X2 [Hydra vulgaris]
MDSFEWVEIIEPTKQEHMFANVKTGQCMWEPPEGVSVKPTHANQWWELFDVVTERNYYYNATSQKTVWRKPKDGDIIPLSNLQMLKAKEASQKLLSKSSSAGNVSEEPASSFSNQYENCDLSKCNQYVVPQVDASSNSKQDINHYENVVHIASENHQSGENKLSKKQSSDLIINEHSETQNMETVKNENLDLSSTQKVSNSFRSKAPPKPPRCDKSLFNSNEGIISNSSDSNDRCVSNVAADSKPMKRQNYYKSTSLVPSVESSVEINNAKGRTFSMSDKFSPRLSQHTEQEILLNLSSSDINDENCYSNKVHTFSSVPSAPPPPDLMNSAKYRQILQNNTLSVYDNVSYDETDLNNVLNRKDKNLTPTTNEVIASSAILSGTETNEPNRNSCYERLHEVETPISQRKLSSGDPERFVPVKRSPLTRMKSDPLDVEKRAKFSKPSISSDVNFRPTSMMNLSVTSRGSRKLSTGEVPENAPPLSTHRTGLLRRRMSIHRMLSWSKSPIKKPMVLTRDKRLRKEAVEVFKLILQYMGDKSTRKTPESLSVEITTKGWSMPLLRDEIYIQLCKQTTGNNKVASLTRGWELITSCLSIFPPSSKFHAYLEGYIYRHLDPEENHTTVRLDLYAKHCYKQLERICQTGAKRGLKGPTIDEIKSAIKRVFNPSMFGNTLDDIMEMQAEHFPENRLPWILTTLTEAILLHNGLQTEGIFRVPGDIDEVNSLKIHVDNWKVPMHMNEPHVAASLLKLWFRDSYEPLIPQRFYDQCIHNCDNTEVCLNIVNSLPALNKLVFSYLIRLLQAFMIPTNVQYSKMDENNLAMVWAPNCLRCPSNDPREIFDCTRKEMAFLRTVMKALDTSFLEGVV